MTSPTPSAQTPVVDKTGKPTVPWARFFASLGSGASPQPAQAVALPASPFDFTAARPGLLVIFGGKVTALAMTRAQVTLSLPAGAAALPLGKGDQVQVTFSAAPQVTFLPS